MLPDEADEMDYAPAPRLEDVVIILGAVEMFQLREALEEVLGDAVEKADTPATFERALKSLLAIRGAPGTAHGPSSPGHPAHAGVVGDPHRRHGPGDQPGRSLRRPDRAVHVVISTVCLQCGTPSDQGRGALLSSLRPAVRRASEGHGRAAELPDLLQDRR